MQVSKSHGSHEESENLAFRVTICQTFPFAEGKRHSRKLGRGFKGTHECGNVYPRRLEHACTHGAVHRVPTATQLVTMAECPLTCHSRREVTSPVGLCAVPDAFVLKVPLEELQAHQGEDAEAEDSEDSHVGQLPHGVDQGSHNDLQSCGKATEVLPCG